MNAFLCLYRAKSTVKVSQREGASSSIRFAGGQDAGVGSITTRRFQHFNLDIRHRPGPHSLLPLRVGISPENHIVKLIHWVPLLSGVQERGDRQKIGLRRREQ